jgi:putative ABC transport system ATP-binding protein
MADVLLSLEAVSKSYWRGSSEIRVLTGASLDVHAGEHMAVWGKRGAGKTTLLRIAAGLESPDEGSVVYDGEDVSRLSEAAYARLMRREVGWVRCEGPSCELAMVDYVALPLLIDQGQRRARARAMDALRRVGTSDCAGQTWGSLSDGERALVAIAHGIVREPRLLLLDDPTANLGLREREEVLELLVGLVREHDLAVLMSVPDMPAAMRSDQLRALSGGRLLVADEPPGGDENVIQFPGRQRSA